MHLGARVSALLDGRLPAAEEERAWSHVHQCHPCRDLVEREGWIKTRLAGLSLADRTDRAAPTGLKDSLLTPASLSGQPPLAPSSLSPSSLNPSLLAPPPAGSSSAAPSLATALTTARRHRSLVAISGGAAGAAVVGVLVLGSAGGPQLDRRVPVSDLSTPAPSLSPTVPDRAPDGVDGATGPVRHGQDARHEDRSVTSVIEMVTHAEVLSQAPRVTMAP